MLQLVCFWRWYSWYCFGAECLRKSYLTFSVVYTTLILPLKVKRNFSIGSDKIVLSFSSEIFVFALPYPLFLFVYFHRFPLKIQRN